MADLDQLGRRHRKLLAELDALRAELAAAICAERDAGATYEQLVARSGYKSIATIVNILDPEKRDEINKRRRANPGGQK